MRCDSCGHEIDLDSVLNQPITGVQQTSSSGHSLVSALFKARKEAERKAFNLEEQANEVQTALTNLTNRFRNFVHKLDNLLVKVEELNRDFRR